MPVRLFNDQWYTSTCIYFQRETTEYLVWNIFFFFQELPTTPIPNSSVHHFPHCFPSHIHLVLRHVGAVSQLRLCSSSSGYRSLRCLLCIIFESAPKPAAFLCFFGLRQGYFRQQVINVAACCCKTTCIYTRQVPKPLLHYPRSCIIRAAEQFLNYFQLNEAFL